MKTEAMRLCSSGGTWVQVIQTKGRNLSILVTPCDFGILLWASSEEFLSLGMAPAVVDLGLRIIPLLGQWMGSGPRLYCGRQDIEGTNWQTRPRQKRL